MVRGTPWVRVKVAARSMARQRCTTAPASGLHPRSPGRRVMPGVPRLCVVLTGIGTVLADNLRLDACAPATPRQPQAVVLDSHLQTNPDAHLFIALAFAPSTLQAILISDFCPKAALEARGATVVQLPGTNGRVDLPALLRDLRTRHQRIACGGRAPPEWCTAPGGLVDELLLYLARATVGPLAAAWPTWCRVRCLWPRGLPGFPRR